MNHLDHQCTFAVEANPLPEDIAIIDDGLGAYNRSHGADDTFTKLEILLRDSRSKVVGALLGGTIWGMLTINILWIAENHRSHGYGRKMVEEAERVAHERGCHCAHVSTISFQAPQFYEKVGYQVVGVMEDVPKGHRIYFLHKLLTGTS